MVICLTDPLERNVLKPAAAFLSGWADLNRRPQVPQARRVLFRTVLET